MLKQLRVPITPSRFVREYDFDARIGNVLLHRGPALFELGDEERGLTDLQRGVALWRKTSGTFMLARNVAILAEYQLRADRLEEARISLGEAERLAEATEEKDQLAEIIRLRGRIWQSEGRHDKARLCFERAIARSRDQRARLFELHAARDLVRLSAELVTRPRRPKRCAASWTGFRPPLPSPSSPNAARCCNSPNQPRKVILTMFPVGDVRLCIGVASGLLVA